MPGVSIAIIRNGRLLWARGYGIRDAGTCEPVTPTTAFQAASISKSLTSVLAMRAVQRGDLALDGDINRFLKRWKLPTGSGVPAGTTVTLAQLLSHTAAVSSPSSAGVRPGDPMPTIVQVLRGEPPALGPPVSISGLPGREFAYSNGGYHVIQLALEDVSGISFSSLVDREILTPLGMSHSSFAQPSTYPERAAGHHEGKPFVGKAYLVPELAAGGLWTTPSDLARLLIAVREAAIGSNERLLLQQSNAQLMIKKGLGGWGLGFSIDGNRFGHDGGFWGMMSRVWIDRVTGDGIVVMANDVEGAQLSDEIIRAAANFYHWKGLESRSFGSARDSAPFYLRGSMNDWGTSNEMKRSGRDRFQVILSLSPGEHTFKVASQDWQGFVLGNSEAAASLRRPLHLSPEGGNIMIRVQKAGEYQFVLDAPGTGDAVLRILQVGVSK